MKITKGKYFIISLVILAPLLLTIMQTLDRSRVLIWVFLEAGYHAPVSFVFDEPFFHSTEIGSTPTMPGKILTGFLYLLIFMCLKYFFDFRKRTHKKS